MLLSLSRRLLAMLLALGLLAATPSSAYDSDYDDEEQEVKKPRKNKSKKKKSISEDDYWDEDSWEDDEVEPITRKKKKKSGKKKKTRKKNKIEEAEDDDGWDDDGSDDDKVTPEDEEDFFGDDAPAPAPPESSLAKPADTASRPAPRDARAECVNLLRTHPGAVEHVELNLVHPKWRSAARINKQQRVMLALRLHKGVATVLEFTERELRVKWDAWAEERFLRQPDNTYMKDSMVKRSGFELSRKARRTAKRLRSRKAVAAENYGWTGKLIDFVTGNEPPLTYKTLRLVNEKMDTKVRFSKAEMVLVKMSGHHEAASVLGYTGVKLHVRWENGEVESYKRLEDGSYRMIDDERVAHQLLDPEKSVREGAQDDWFIIWCRDVMNEEKPLSYVNVKLKKNSQEYHPRISMDNLVLMQTPPHQGWAKVIKYDRKQLIIRWDGVREELYERGDDGVYYFMM